MDNAKRKELATRAAYEAEKARIRAQVPRTASVDPVAVAEACKCEVRFMTLPSLEGVYSPEPRPAIVLGAERPAGRRAFNCAHELGHHVFNHGVRIEELNAQHFDCEAPPEEFLADVFAGFLLMSLPSVRRSLKDRNWRPEHLCPHEIFRLACFFGVGYAALVQHLTWSLRMLEPGRADQLLKFRPKDIKARHAVPPDAELVLVDHHWTHRAVDLAVGDTVVLPSGTDIDGDEQLVAAGARECQLLFRAVAPGYARAHQESGNWAVNMRIARKQYQGLAKYRFYPEAKDDP
jgi:Zn-dependent peptidase ImmA (M78 family)